MLWGARPQREGPAPAAASDPAAARPVGALSGTAIGTQFGFALAGFTPTIASALIGSDSSNWVRVALFTAVACVISAIELAAVVQPLAPVH
jgi:uncharacterized membrane protein